MNSAEPDLLDTSKLIVGASGSGKTVTAKAEVGQLLDQARSQPLAWAELTVPAITGANHSTDANVAGAG